MNLGMFSLNYAEEEAAKDDETIDKRFDELDTTTKLRSKALMLFKSFIYRPHALW
jgi:hypothetical protein